MHGTPSIVLVRCVTVTTSRDGLPSLTPGVDVAGPRLQREPRVVDLGAEACRRRSRADAGRRASGSQRSRGRREARFALHVRSVPLVFPGRAQRCNASRTGRATVQPTSRPVRTGAWSFGCSVRWRCTTARTRSSSAGRSSAPCLRFCLLRAGEVVSVDALTDALWGDEPPRTVADRRSTTSSPRLRKLLGAGAARRRGRPATCSTSRTTSSTCSRFGGSSAAAKVAPAEERVELLRRRRVALARARRSPEFAYDELRADRDRAARGAAPRRVEERIDGRARARARTPSSSAELEGLVLEHPLRERLARAVDARALPQRAARPRRSRAYQDARRALVDELGLEPGRALQQLHAAILRQERSLDELETRRRRRRRRAQDGRRRAARGTARARARRRDRRARAQARGAIRLPAGRGRRRSSARRAVRRADAGRRGRSTTSCTSSLGVDARADAGPSLLRGAAAGCCASGARRTSCS